MSDEDRFKQIEGGTLDEAMSKGIGQLGAENDEDKAKILSNIKRESDIARYLLMFSVEQGTSFKFLGEYARDGLKMSNSLKGLARSQITTVVKQPPMERSGFLGRAKDFLGS